MLVSVCVWQLFVYDANSLSVIAEVFGIVYFNMNTMMGIKH